MSNVLVIQLKGILQIHFSKIPTSFRFIIVLRQCIINSFNNLNSNLTACSLFIYQVVKKMHKCETAGCSEEFSSEKRLHRHQKTHTGCKRILSPYI